MKRIYFLALVLFFGLWYMGILATGVEVGVFLNPICLILILAVPLVLMLSNFSPREIIRCFTVGFGPKTTGLREKEVEIKELRNALLFFSALQRFFILTGMTGVLVGAVAILVGLTDAAALASGVAIALLTVVYALILTTCLTIPFRTGLSKRLIDLGETVV